MKKTLLVLLFVLSFTSLGTVNQLRAQSDWFVAYWPTWSGGYLGQAAWTLPPWEVKWTGITHVVHFGNDNIRTGTAPYFGPVVSANDSIEWTYNGIANPGGGPSTWTNWQDSLIRIGHRNGAKVLIGAQSVNGALLNFIVADSIRTENFVNSVVAYAKRKGYDGVSMNWEGWQVGITGNVANISRFIRRMRVALNTMNPVGIFHWAIPVGEYSKFDPNVTNSRVDMFHLEVSEYFHAYYSVTNSNVTWFINPLHRGDAPSAPSPFNGWSIDTKGPLQWINYGHSASKIGMLINAFGWVAKGTNQLFQPYDPGEGYANYQDVTRLLSNGGVETWDDQRKAHYVAGTALRSEGNTWWGQPGVLAGQKFFATYSTPLSIQEAIAWGKVSGLGGYGLYDLTKDLDPSKPLASRNPLHNALAEALGTPPPAPDVIAPTVSITSPPNGSTVSNTITITGVAADNNYVSRVDIRIDGGGLNRATGAENFSYSLNTRTLSNGNHTITAIATDGSGNTASATITVNVNNVADSTPPTVSITFPANGTTVSGVLVVSATASDDVGVSGVQFKLDTVSIWPEDVSSPYSVTWNTRSSTNGSHILTAIARDATGNTASSSVTVTVSNVFSLALNKTVTVSSVEPNSDLTGAKAVDGNLSTRWGSAWSDPQWIYVDLAATFTVNNVVLIWEPAYAIAYQIQVSTDAVNWTTVFSTTTGNGGTDEISFAGVNARYVRMYGTQRATIWGYSLTEFEIYGSTPSVGLASVPILVSPIVDATGIFTSPTLIWNTSSGATSYTLRVSTVSNFATTVFNQSGISDTTFSVSGLFNSTVYYWHVSASNIAGTSAYSTTRSFTTIDAPAPSAIISDDFNSSSLKSFWTFVNPLNDAVLTIVGVGTSNARARIFVPAEVSHDIWTTGNFAPRLMQSITNGNFEVEVRFEGPLTQQYQLQGIIVQETVQNYIRFGFVKDVNRTRAFVATFINNVPQIRVDIGISTTNDLYLRVKRQGNQWTQSHSYDGVSWTTNITFTHSLTVSSVGPFVGNAGAAVNTAPAFTGLIDYFFNTASPVVPEDSSITPIVTIPLPPVLISPGNQTTGVSTSPTLTWNSSTGATSYRLRLSLVSTFSPRVKDTTITNTSCTLLDLYNNTTYYWHVSAANVTGASSYSDAFSFTTSPVILSRPILKAPSQGIRFRPTTLTLSWYPIQDVPQIRPLSPTSTVEGELFYRVQVSSSGAFTTTFFDSSGVSSTFLVVSGLSSKTIYYWRVMANGIYGNSPFSMVRRFKTK